MPRRLSTDMSLDQFRREMKLKRIGYLANVNRFIDLEHRRAKRLILPVTDDHGRLLRAASLQSVLAARAAYEAELAAADAKRESEVALAAKLAPAAVASPRADLTGAAAIAQLADDFIVQATRSDGVAIADLVRMGWSRAQLDAHADAARIVADRRQDRQAEDHQAEAFA